MTHPLEAQALNGFGPKTCERLEKKLRAHCEENGMPMPKPRKRASNDLDGSLLDTTPAKKPRKTTKPYVPQLRSGPYALLLALASLGDDECVSKQQLIELAQPHCDASFVAPRDTTSFHTAWSSMTTLVNKDLVKESRGVQRRYSLTDEGWEVAEKMKRVGKGGHEELDVISGPNAKRSASNLTNVSNRNRGDARFSAWTDLPEVRVPLARTDLNTLQPSEASGQRLGGAVADKYGTLTSSTKSRDIPKDARRAREAFRPNKAIANMEDDALLAARLQAQEDDRTRPAGQEVDFLELLSSPPPEARPVHRFHKSKTYPTSERPSMSRDSEAPQELQHQPVNFVPPPFNPITLQPSTFTIELILDNREIRSREDRNYIETQLITKGVRPLIRSLPLGDFFWVAKCHDPNLLPRYGEEGDLIALDYIVERKRLDDLISSIKDGRFHEQKFRLRKSGAKNVIYLIEEIGISQEMKNKYWAAMQTAVASTQVIDGFTVKRTRGLDESIRYLTRMTRLLKSLYELFLLFSIQVREPHLERCLSSHAKSVLTYHRFHLFALEHQNEVDRIGDAVTTKGLTGDKAIEIQRVWPTPRALVSAFSKCKDDKEREGMVDKALDERGVLGRGKVGKQLSKMLSQSLHLIDAVSHTSIVRTCPFLDGAKTVTLMIANRNLNT
ncbi:MAG: hypothetical protein Q9219_003013 [cf. Caloplaca sp. 3 TL-2023]